MSALASWTGLSDNATFQQLNEQNPVFSPVVSMIHSCLPAAGSRPYFIYEESCYTSVPWRIASSNVLFSC